MGAPVDSLLPPNASPLERAIESVIASRLAAVPVPVSDMASAHRIVPAALPFLAWGLSVDDWSPAWPLSLQRDATAASLATHRLKGTVGAVRRALTALAVDVEIVEWWQRVPRGRAHTFSVIGWVSDALAADGPVHAGQLWASLRGVLENTKPARSFFDLTVGLSSKAIAGIASAHVSGAIATLCPYFVTLIEAAAPIPCVGVFTLSGHVAELRPHD